MNEQRQEQDNANKALQLATFYQNYIHAFSTAIITAVAKCYQLPCVLSTPDKVLVLDGEQSFNQEFSGIFAMLAEHNITGFKASNASYQHINEAISLVKIDWRFYDQANNLFSEFSAIYHLSYQQEAYRIINVISHDMCQLADLAHELTLIPRANDTNNSANDTNNKETDK
ncbi:hypothetical protein [Thalassotalea euphylliae]|uniref:Uncharacterized protein n=1 Tax=Thalassotalea euphylliae TaxID=1655234 RepID=A0A3E0U1I1_9GAMM|nr:hypothetical protein [Thalassotalea euphylliae]REL29892.1 hypothetical protein DXX94_03775 [Thalassotalea euphylliae]